MPGWYEPRSGGVALRVRVTPRGGADRIDGPAMLSDGSAVLKVRVKAAPEDGAASAAVERLLARALGVAPAAITVAGGHRARLKTLHVTGKTGELIQALDVIGAGSDRGKEAHDGKDHRREGGRRRPAR